MSPSDNSLRLDWELVKSKSASECDFYLGTSNRYQCNCNLSGFLLIKHTRQVKSNLTNRLKNNYYKFNYSIISIFFLKNSE